MPNFVHQILFNYEIECTKYHFWDLLMLFAGSVSLGAEHQAFLRLTHLSLFVRRAALYFASIKSYYQYYELPIFPLFLEKGEQKIQTTANRRGA